MWDDKPLEFKGPGISGIPTLGSNNLSNNNLASGLGGFTGPGIGLQSSQLTSANQISNIPTLSSNNKPSSLFEEKTKASNPTLNMGGSGANKPATLDFLVS